MALKPGQQYTLVTTTESPNAFGGFTWRIYSESNGTILSACAGSIQQTAEAKKLDCHDIDLILVDYLDQDIPRCYRTDKDGNIIFPPNPADQEKVEELLELLSRTGFPNADPLTAMGGSVTDDCDYLEICVEDEIMEVGDCGLVEIRRTFSVKDKQSNYVDPSPCSGTVEMNTCEQIITIGKPDLNAIILPPSRVFLTPEDITEIQ